MQPLVITTGITPAELIELLRPMVRHELQQASVVAPAAPVTEEVLTLKQAAELLDVSQHTIHDWKRRGLLPFFKIGGRTYFKRAEIVAGLQSQQRTLKAGRRG